MDTLPVELLDHIVHFCDHASRKSLRRTSKAFEDLSTPSIFEHHFMATFESSLSKFESIANSRLAKYVKRLTYLNDTLPKFSKKQYLAIVDLRPDFHVFREQRKDEFPDEVQDPTHFRIADVWRRAHDAWEALPRHNFTKRDLDRRYKEYQRLFKEQKQWGKLGQDSRIQTSFQKLTNLVEVDVMRALYENSGASQWPIWRRLRNTMLLGPETWVGGLDADEEDIEFPILETATLCMLEAIAQRHREHANGVRPVTTIRLQGDLGAPTSFISNWTNSLYGTAPESQQWATTLDGPLPPAKAFMHVTTLVVRLTDTRLEDWPAPHVTAVWAQLHHFLSVARNLRNLTLLLDSDLEMPHLDEDIDQWGGEEPGISIFDAETTLWPHIEHISLSINCESESLLRLLRLHSSTLRSLEIRKCFFDNVPAILSQIPKILSLNHVYLDGLWHLGPESLPHDDSEEACLLTHGTENQQPYEIAMKQYLLGESQSMPDLLQDDLGHEGSDLRKNPPSTVFEPHNHHDHKRALWQF